MIVVRVQHPEELFKSIPSHVRYEVSLLVYLRQFEIKTAVLAIHNSRPIKHRISLYVTSLKWKIFCCVL